MIDSDVELSADPRSWQMALLAAVSPGRRVHVVVMTTTGARLQHLVSFSNTESVGQ